MCLNSGPMCWQAVFQKKSEKRAKPNLEQVKVVGNRRAIFATPKPKHPPQHLVGFLWFPLNNFVFFPFIDIIRKNKLMTNVRQFFFFQNPKGFSNIFNEHRVRERSIQMVSKKCCSTPSFLFLMSVAVFTPLFSLGFLPLFYISFTLTRY